MKFDLGKLQQALASEEAGEYAKLAREQGELLAAILKPLEEAAKAADKYNAHLEQNNIQEFLTEENHLKGNKIADALNRIASIV